jgi:hypothetical protein
MLKNELPLDLNQRTIKKSNNEKNIILLPKKLNFE